MNEETTVRAEWTHNGDGMLFTMDCTEHPEVFHLTIEYGNMQVPVTGFHPEQWRANDDLTVAVVRKEGCEHLTAEMVAAARAEIGPRG